jgi:hypothetical protein
MTAEKIARMESIGFKWAKPKGDMIWNIRFEELRSYKAVTGNCNVPTKYGANPALGRWVSTQRSQYKEMQLPETSRKKLQLTPARIAKLNAIGFTWDMIRRRDDNDENY